MPVTPRPTRAVLIAIALPLALVLFSRPAGAAGMKQACVDASSEGQTLRDSAKFVEARARFLACSRDECPNVVRKYCVEWLADVERRMPTVIFRAQAADGSDVTGAQIAIDGALVHEPLGTAIPLDPGEHAIHVERAGGAPLDSKVVIIDGEKGRIVPLRFPSAAAAAATHATPPPPAESRPLFTPATWVFGGIGVAGLAAFGVLAIKASSDLNNLRGTCAPYCASSQLDSVKHEALGADISLGIGLVALGAAAITLVVGHGGSEKAGLIVDGSGVGARF